MNPKEELKKLGIEVDDYIESFKLKNADMGKRYIQAVDPGKKLRGALVLLGYKFFKEDYKKVMPAAGAVEIMHKATLVHDDIGDADEYRRGLPTLYKDYDLDDAIYSGDLVFSIAYKELEKLENDFDTEKIWKCNKLLNHFFLRVNEGQLLDTFFEKHYDITEKDYFWMVKEKTCTALEVALGIGAVLGDGENFIKNLEEYAEQFGYAFQIQNDINSILGVEKGRREASDIYEKKRTLLLIKTLEMIDSEQKEVLKTILDKKELSQEDVSKVMEFMKESGAIDYCKKLVEAYGIKARESLSSLPNSEAKEILIGFVDTTHITDKGYWTEHAKTNEG